MLSKTSIAILAAAAIFGAASAAQASSSRDDADHSGGFRIGPMGQVMGGASTWRGRPRGVYAYVPRARLDRRWYYEDSSGRRTRY